MTTEEGGALPGRASGNPGLLAPDVPCTHSNGASSCGRTGRPKTYLGTWCPEVSRLRTWASPRPTGHPLPSLQDGRGERGWQRVGPEEKGQANLRPTVSAGEVDPETGTGLRRGQCARAGAPMHMRVQCVRERVRGSGEGHRVWGERVQVCTCVSGRLSGGAPARWDPAGQGSGGEQGQRSLCSEGTRIPLGQLGPP